MPTKRRVALTDDVYEALMKLKEQWGLESPNQVIRELIKRVTLSHGVTPSNRVTPSQLRSGEGAQGVTLTKSEGVTPSQESLANGVTLTWSSLCGLWDKIKDRVEFSEYLYSEFRKLLESLLPSYNSNELIEEFESCGLIDVEGNVVRVKRR